jgi:glucose-1-phosphate thymidylyltransferase
MACIEDLAYKLDYIDRKQLLKAAEFQNENSYGEYFKVIAEQGGLNAL